MAIEVGEAGEHDACEWDAFVQGHSSATVYHLWPWRRVFEEVFGHRTVYLIARRGGVVAGILPLVRFDTWLFGRFMVSLPFVNYGGVVASDDVVARALLDAARAQAQHARARHVELRDVRRRFPELPARSHKVAMLLRLRSSEAEQWDGLDRKVRNQVRKAERSGLVASIGGRELVPDFYDVFAENMRDLGTPVYSRRLFEAVIDALPTVARVLVVRHGGRSVAGGIAISWRGRIEVPWASSLGTYRVMCPNNLLYWTAIRHAIESGCDTLDFGRSTPDSGTFHFKRQWGAEALPLFWEYVLMDGATLPDQSPSNPKFHMAVEAWKRLPLAATNVLGPHIVRAIP